jgi:hypothetical protein
VPQNNLAAQSLYDYKLESDRAVAGMPYDSADQDQLAGLNSGTQTEQSIGDITIGGTIAAGNIFNITIAVRTAIGSILARTASYTAIAADTAAIVAGKLRDAINAEELLNDYLDPTAAAAVLKLPVRPGRKIESITASAQGAATITAAPAIVSATDPSPIKWGYFAAQYPGFSDMPTPQVSTITTATNAVIRGICRLLQIQDREYPYDSIKEFGLQPYKAGLFVIRGRIWVPPLGAVARGQRAAYINTTGQPCAEGTANSTVVPGTTFFTDNGTDGLAVLSINLPA